MATTMHWDPYLADASRITCGLAIAAELKLGKDSSSEDELLDAMAENPILINRPIVVTDKAVKLCRPSETVKEIVG